MSGRILFLNGAPSSGKTTLAKAVQERCPEPLFHRSLDDFLEGYAPAARLAVPGLFDRVLAGYLGALRELAAAGIDLIAEAVIIPERVDQYVETFAGCSVLLVGVHCPLAIAQERESARLDRPGGPLVLDVPWFETVHDLPYDLEVETGDRQTLAAAVEAVTALFMSPPESRAFDGLRARLD